MKDNVVQFHKDDYVLSSKDLKDIPNMKTDYEYHYIRPYNRSRGVWIILGLIIGFILTAITLLI